MGAGRAWGTQELRKLVLPYNVGECQHTGRLLWEGQKMRRGLAHNWGIPEQGGWFLTERFPFVPLSFFKLIIFYFKIFYSFYFPFSATPCGIGDLVPRLRIEPVPLALGAWSLNQWTAREVPHVVYCFTLYQYSLPSPEEVYTSPYSLKSDVSSKLIWPVWCKWVWRKSLIGRNFENKFVLCHTFFSCTTLAGKFPDNGFSIRLGP